MSEHVEVGNVCVGCDELWPCRAMLMAEIERLRALELERADDWLDPWVQTAFLATAELHKTHGDAPWRDCAERWCRLIQEQAQRGGFRGPSVAEAEIDRLKAENAHLEGWGQNTMDGCLGVLTKARDALHGVLTALGLGSGASTLLDELDEAVRQLGAGRG